MNLTARIAADNMLRDAGMDAPPSDIKLLANDIVEVSRELDDNYSDTFAISHAKRELERRIGGLRNLPSYMACLRVHVK